MDINENPPSLTQPENVALHKMPITMQKTPPQGSKYMVKYST